MDLLYQLFGESIGLITLVGLVKLTVWAIFVGLGIRFLVDVPDYLKDIAVSLRYLRKGSPDTKPISKVPYIPKNMLFDNDRVYRDDGNDDHD